MGTHSVSVNALVNLLVGNDQVASRLAEYSKGVNVPVNFGGKNGTLPSKSLMTFNKLVDNTNATVSDFTKTLGALSKSKSILHWSEDAQKGIKELYQSFSKMPLNIQNKVIGDQLINAYNGQMLKLMRETGKIMQGESGAYYSTTALAKALISENKKIKYAYDETGYRYNNSGAMRTLAAKGIETLVMDYSELSNKYLRQEYDRILSQGQSYNGKQYSFLAQSAALNKEGKMILVEKSQLETARKSLGMLTREQYLKAGISEPKATSYEGLSFSETSLMESARGQIAKPKVIVLNDLNIAQELTDTKGNPYTVQYKDSKGNVITTTGNKYKNGYTSNNITDGLVLSDPKFAKTYNMEGANQIRLANTKGLAVSYNYKKQFADSGYTGGLKDIWGNEVTPEMIQNSDMILTGSSAKLAKAYKNVGEFLAAIDANPLLNGKMTHEISANNKGSYSVTQWLDYMKMGDADLTKAATLFSDAVLKQITEPAEFAKTSGVGVSSTFGKFLKNNPLLLSTEAMRPIMDNMLGSYSIDQVKKMVKASGTLGKAIAQKGLLEGISTYSYLTPEIELIVESWATGAYNIGENGKYTIDTSKAKFRLGKEQVIVGGKGQAKLGETNIVRYPANTAHRAENILVGRRGLYYTGDNYSVISNATPYQTMLTGSDWDGDTGLFFNNKDVFGKNVFRRVPLNLVELDRGNVQGEWNSKARALRMATGKLATLDLGYLTNIQSDVNSAFSRIANEGTIVPQGRNKQNDMGVLNQYLNSLQLLRDANVDVTKNNANILPLIKHNEALAKKALEVLTAYGEAGAADSARLMTKALKESGEAYASKSVTEIKDNVLTLRIKETTKEALDRLGSERWSASLTRSFIESITGQSGAGFTYSALTDKTIKAFGLQGRRTLGGDLSYEDIVKLTGQILGYTTGNNTEVKTETARAAEKMMREMRIDYTDMFGKTFDGVNKLTQEYIKNLLSVEKQTKGTSKSVAGLSEEYKTFNSQGTYEKAMQAALSKGVYSKYSGQNQFNSLMIDTITDASGKTIDLTTEMGNKLGLSLLAQFTKEGRQEYLIPESEAVPGRLAALGKDGKGYKLEMNGQEYTLMGLGLVALDTIKKISNPYKELTKFTPSDLGKYYNVSGYFGMLNELTLLAGYAESKGLIGNTLSRFGGIEALGKAANGGTTELLTAMTGILQGGNENISALMSQDTRVSGAIGDVLLQAAKQFRSAITAGERFESNGVLTEWGALQQEMFRSILRGTTNFVQGVSNTQEQANANNIKAGLLAQDNIETQNAKKRQQNFKKAADMQTTWDEAIRSGTEIRQENIVALQAANKATSENTQAMALQTKVIYNGGTREVGVSQFQNWRVGDLEYPMAETLLRRGEIYLITETSTDKKGRTVKNIRDVTELEGFNMFANSFQELVIGALEQRGYLTEKGKIGLPKNTKGEYMVARDHIQNLENIIAETEAIKVYNGFEDFLLLLKSGGRKSSTIWGVKPSQLSNNILASLGLQLFGNVPEQIAQEYFGTNTLEILNLLKTGKTFTEIQSLQQASNKAIPETALLVLKSYFGDIKKGSASKKNRGATVTSFDLMTESVESGNLASNILSYLMQDATWTSEMEQKFGTLARSGNLKILETAIGGKNFINLLSGIYGENSPYGATARNIRNAKESGAPDSVIKYYELQAKFGALQTYSAITDEALAQVRSKFTTEGFLGRVEAGSGKEAVLLTLTNQLLTTAAESLTARNSLEEAGYMLGKSAQQAMFDTGLTKDSSLISSAKNKDIAKELLGGKLKATSISALNANFDSAAALLGAVRDAALTGYKGEVTLTDTEQRAAMSTYEKAVRLATSTLYPTKQAGITGAFGNVLQGVTDLETSAKSFEENLSNKIKADSELAKAKKALDDTVREGKDNIRRAKETLALAEAAKEVTGQEYIMSKMLETNESGENIDKYKKEATPEHKLNVAAEKKALLDVLRTSEYVLEQTALAQERVAAAEQATNEANMFFNLSALARAATAGAGNKLKLRGQAFTNASNQGMMEMMGALMIFETFKGIVTGMYSYVKAFDDQMREYKKIQPNWNEKDMRNYVRGLSDLGLTYGKTVEEMAEASIVMTRGGYGGADAASKQINRGMTEAALLMSNIADEELAVSDASDQLISVAKAYGYSDSEVGQKSTRIVDMVNEVSNNMSITSNDLMEAMPIVASLASVSGLTEAELIGLITGGAEISQDANKTSTAMKTMMGRFNLINDTSSSTGRWLKNWLDKKIGEGNYRDENGNLDFYKAVMSIGLQWESWTSDEQSLFSQKFAGSRQASNFANWMNNLEGIEKAKTLAEGSAGSAAASNEAKMDSIEGRLSQFLATVSDIATDTLNSGVIKGLVSVANAMAKMFNAIPGSSQVAGILAITAMLGTLGTLIPAMVKFYGMGALGGMLNTVGTGASLLATGGVTGLIEGVKNSKTGRNLIALPTVAGKTVKDFFTGITKGAPVLTAELEVLNATTKAGSGVTAASAAQSAGANFAKALPYLGAIAGIAATLKLIAAGRDAMNQSIITGYEKLMTLYKSIEDKKYNILQLLRDINNDLLESELISEGYNKDNAENTEKFKSEYESRALDKDSSTEKYRKRGNALDNLEYNDLLHEYDLLDLQLIDLAGRMLIRERQYIDTLFKQAGVGGMLMDWSGRTLSNLSEDAYRKYKAAESGSELAILDTGRADYYDLTSGWSLMSQILRWYSGFRESANYQNMAEVNDSSKESLQTYNQIIDFAKLKAGTNDIVEALNWISSADTSELPLEYKDFVKNWSEIMDILSNADYLQAMTNAGIELDSDTEYLSGDLQSVVANLGTNTSAAEKANDIKSKAWDKWTGEDLATISSAFSALDEDLLTELYRTKREGTAQEFNDAWIQALADNLLQMYGNELLKEMDPEVLAKYYEDWGHSVEESKEMAYAQRNLARENYNKEQELLQQSMGSENYAEGKLGNALSALSSGDIAGAVNQLEYETDTRKKFTDEEGYTVFGDTVEGLVLSLNDLGIGTADAMNMFDEWLKTNKILDENGNEIDMTDEANQRKAWQQFSETFLAGSNESVTALNSNTIATNNLTGALLETAGLNPEDYGFVKTEQGGWLTSDLATSLGMVATKDENGNLIYINPNSTDYIKGIDGDKTNYFAPGTNMNENYVDTNKGWLAKGLENVSWFLDANGNALFITGFDSSKSNPEMFTSNKQWDSTLNNGAGGWRWNYTPTSNNPNYKPDGDGGYIPVNNYRSPEGRHYQGLENTTYTPVEDNVGESKRLPGQKYNKDTGEWEYPQGEDIWFRDNPVTPSEPTPQKTPVEEEDNVGTSGAYGTHYNKQTGLWDFTNSSGLNDIIIDKDGVSTWLGVNGRTINGVRNWDEEEQDWSTDTTGRAANIDTPLGDKVKDLFGKIGDGLSDLIPKAEAGLVKDNYSDTTMDNTVRGELQKDGKITYEAEVEDVEIPEVEDLQMTIEADTSDAQAKLELLGQMDIPTVDVKVEAKLANAKILDVTSGIEGVEGQTPTVTVDAKDNASKTLDKIKSTVNSIPSNKTITVSVSGAESAANKLAHLKSGSARGGIIGSTAPQQIGERHADGGTTGSNGLVGTWLGDEYGGSGEKKPELVVTPDGNAHLAGLNGWEYEELPKGTRVYSNSDTKKLLGERHANGGFLGVRRANTYPETDVNKLALSTFTDSSSSTSSSSTSTSTSSSSDTKTSAAAAATAKSTANVEGYVEDIAESLKTLVEQYDTMISVIDDSLDLLEYEEEKTDKPSEKRFELLANKLDVLTKYQKALEDAGATTENSADYRDVLKQVEEVKAEKLEAIIAGYEHRLDANETKRALIEEQNYMDPLAGFDDLMATYASDREMINKQIQAYLDAGYSWGSDEIRDLQEKLIDVNESERDLIDEKTDKIIDKIDESIDTQDSIDKYAKHLIDQKREEIEENVEYMQQQYDDETEKLSKLDTIIDRQKRLLDAEADLTEAENKRVLVLGDNGWEWDSNPQEVEDAKKALQDTKDAIAKEERDEKRADELKEKIAAEWEKYYGEGSEGKKAYATLDSIYEQEKELADRQEEMNLLESKVLFQEEYGNALLEDVLQSLNSEAKQEEIKLKYIDKYVMDILNDEVFSGIDFSEAIDKNGNVDIMAAVQLAIDEITAKQDISEDLQNLLNKALKLRGEKQLTLGATLADNIEVTNKGLVDANGNLIETKATSATTAENTAEAKETSAATAENTAETNDKLDESNKIAQEAIKKDLAAAKELLDQMRENGTITEDCYYALLSMLKAQQGTTTTTTTTESSGGKSVSRASSSTWGYAQQMLEDGREISDYGMYMINGGTGSEAEYREWQEKLNQKISDKNNAVSSNSSTDNSTNISVDNLNVNANNADELVQSMLNYKNANSSSKGNSSNKNSLANKSGSSVSHAIKF